MRFTHVRRAALAMLAGCATVLATLIPAIGAGAAAAGPVCSYQVSSDWGSGFTAQVTITNNGPALLGWDLQYAYSGNQHLVNGWDGTWSQSGQTVTVTNASWNGSLPTGGSVTAGAQFSYSGTNTPPPILTLNGNPCNGTATSSPSASASSSSSAPAQPTVNITNPAPQSVIPAGSTVTVSAQASAGGTDTVTAVTFYATNYCTKTATELGKATSAPYTTQWTNIQGGPFGISAVVTTSAGANVMSAAVPVNTSGSTTPPCESAEPAGNPAIAIVAPQPNTIVDSNTTVPVTAVASVASGFTITSVTFYAVDTCGLPTTTTLGTVTSAPYTFQWVNPPAGIYTLTAVLTAGSAPVTSAPVQIFAGPNRVPPPCPSWPSGTPTP